MHFLGKRSHRFTSFQKKGLHYINTPKQLILDFYDCINANFNVKIVIVLLLFSLRGSKINCGYSHNLFLSKKKEEENAVLPCLKPSFTIHKSSV